MNRREERPNLQGARRESAGGMDEFGDPSGGARDAYYEAPAPVEHLERIRLTRQKLETWCAATRSFSHLPAHCHSHLP